MSACSDSQSTILPFPSSPHWDPTTTTLAMRRLSSASATPGIFSKRQRLVRHSDPHRIGNDTLQASRHRRDGASRPQPNCLILRVLFTLAVAPRSPQRMIWLSPRQSRGNIAAASVMSLGLALRERRCAAPQMLGRRTRSRSAPTAAVFLMARGQTAHQARGFKQSLACVSHLTSAGGGVPHAEASLVGSEGVMETRTEVAHYAATMTREL